METHTHRVLELREPRQVNPPLSIVIPEDGKRRTVRFPLVLGELCLVNAEAPIVPKRITYADGVGYGSLLVFAAGVASGGIYKELRVVSGIFGTIDLLDTWPFQECCLIEVSSFQLRRQIHRDLVNSNVGKVY